MNAPADDGPSRDELYERAQELDIEGRSDMNKDELAAAVEAAESGSDDSGAAAAPSDPLRHTPGATTPKTGPVPPATPVEGSGNISERRYGGGRSLSRVITSGERREERRERLAQS